MILFARPDTSGRTDKTILPCWWFAQFHAIGYVLFCWGFLFHGFLFWSFLSNLALHMGNGLRMRLAKKQDQRQPPWHHLWRRGKSLQYAFLPQDVQQKGIWEQDEGYRNTRGDILRYAGGHLHDGDGTLHPFLRDGRQKSPTFFHKHDGGQRK